MESTGTPVRFYYIFGAPVLTAQVKTKAKTLLHFAFVLIAVCMVLDSVPFLISLGFRHAQSARSRRCTMRRNSCRVSLVSRGRIMLPVGLSGRGAQGKLLCRRDEYKREANWCVDHLALRYIQPHAITPGLYLVQQQTI